MNRYSMVLLAVLVAGWCGTARAQEASAGGAEAAGDTAAPRTTEQRLEALEQNQKILERRLELEQETAEAKAKDSPVVTAGREGFSLAGPGGSARVKIRGLIHIDTRVYVGNDPKNNPDGFLARRVRPIIEGTLWKYYDFLIVPDFGDGKTQLIDAYLGMRYRPELMVRAGKIKAPVGLERQQAINDISFIEFALPTNLLPNRDVGVMIYGEPLEGVIAWALAVTNGVPDGGSADRNADGMFDYNARLFVLPFKSTEVEWLRGLGVGVAGTSGRHLGTLATPEVSGYRSAGQMVFFKYRSDAKDVEKTVIGDGLLQRWTPQFYYFWGPFGVMGEYAESSQEVRLGDEEQRLTNTSWQVTASFVLTGEDVGYRAVKPRSPLDPQTRGLGAWQLVGRYEELSVDDDAFPVFARRATSAGRAHGWGAGLNGYLNTNVRVMIDYDETAFVGGGAGESRPTERVWLGRLQVAF